MSGFGPREGRADTGPMHAVTPVADLFPATVGERVTAARVRAGMSVEQAVGDEAVLSAETLRGIEAGTADRVSIADLLWLAWTFACSLSSRTGRGVRERALVSHHGAPDMTVVERLVEFLELAAYLEDQGVPDPSRSRG